MARTPGETAADTIRAELARQRRRQAHLAEALGLSPATVSRRLSGEHPLTIDELYAAASWLGIDPLELLPRPAELAGVRALELLVS